MLYRFVLGLATRHQPAAAQYTVGGSHMLASKKDSPLQSSPPSCSIATSSLPRRHVGQSSELSLNMSSRHASIDGSDRLRSLSSHQEMIDDSDRLRSTRPFQLPAVGDTEPAVLTYMESCDPLLSRGTRTNRSLSAPESFFGGGHGNLWWRKDANREWVSIYWRCSY